MYYEPTPISWEHYHFLIMSAPDKKSMKKCIKVRKLKLTNQSVGFEKQQRKTSSKSL